MDNINLTNEEIKKIADEIKEKISGFQKAIRENELELIKIQDACHHKIKETWIDDGNGNLKANRCVVCGKKW